MADKIKASHILIATADGERSKSQLSAEDAEAKINELKQELDDGADFADLAKENSDCPSGADSGNLGFFGPNDMVPSFGAAAFALEEGEASDVVKTSFGFHLILRTG
jgi:NIMA-interacting peptidyl-prolyl cis-trans isomerase 1